MSRAAAALLAAALALGPPGLVFAGQMVLVDQVGRSFSSRELRLHRGDTVRFRNSDSFVHQVGTSNPSFSFTTAEQEPGQVIDIRFPTAGTFMIRCEVHPRMALSVIVDDGRP